MRIRKECLGQGVSGHCLMLQVNLSNTSRTQGGNSFDDSTLPLIDRNQKTGTCLPCSACPCCHHSTWECAEELAFVPSLLFSPGFLGSHSCSHKAINLGFRWLLRARKDLHSCGSCSILRSTVLRLQLGLGSSS